MTSIDVIQRMRYDIIRAFSVVLQATSTEVWIYRNSSLREAVVAFRGTSNPQDMMTDASLALSAFSPGHR